MHTSTQGLGTVSSRYGSMKECARELTAGVEASYNAVCVMCI